MSPSTSNTRLPICASATAIAYALVLLPSFFEQLVNTIVLGAPLDVENCNAVRTDR